MPSAGAGALLTRRATGAARSATDIASVLRSLVPAHVDVLRLIAAAQRDGAPHSHETLLASCKRRLTVGSGGAQALHGFVAELVDHDIIKLVDGAYVLRARADVVDAALAAREAERR